MPVATRALPCDHVIRSAAVASASLVGLLNGKMMGRAVCALMVSTISWVKVLGRVEVPTKIVGLMVLTTAVRLVSSAALANSLRRRANGRCSGVKSSMSSNNKPCLSTR